MIPAVADHPRLHALWNEATSLAYFVRAHLKLAPTSPEWLAMDDDMVLDEAMRIVYADLHRQRENDNAIKAATTPGLAQQYLDEMEAKRTDTTWQADFTARLNALRNRSKAKPGTDAAPDTPKTPPRGRFTSGRL